MFLKRFLPFVEGRLPFGDLHKTISYEDIHLKKFQIEDLQLLHGLIYDFGYELIVSLQNEVILTSDKRPVSIVSTETDFLSLIHSLGPPPDRTALKRNTKIVKKQEKPKKLSIFGKPEDKPQNGKKKVGEAIVRENLRGRTYKEIETALLSLSIDNLMEHADQFDTTDLEASRFIYIGKNTRSKLPTVYVCLHRY